MEAEDPVSFAAQHAEPGNPNQIDLNILDEPFYLGLHNTFTNDSTSSPMDYLSDPFLTFEDPFIYSSPLPDLGSQPTESNEGSDSAQSKEKLLGCSSPKFFVTLMDTAGSRVNIFSMTADLRGMFFVAEDPFHREDPGQPVELTCYRRNLWQCHCEITLPKCITRATDRQGNESTLSELAVFLTATESIEGKPAQIITIPWKATDPASNKISHSTSAPAAYPIDLAKGQEDNAGRVTSKLVWTRLQFKHATAYNGRRKGLQQSYTLKIQLQGKTGGGDWIKISEIQSSPIIVRGRSPRHSDKKKEIRLKDEKRGEKRPSLSLVTSIQSVNRKSQGDFDGAFSASDGQPSASGRERAGREKEPPIPAAKRHALSPRASRRRTKTLTTPTSSAPAKKEFVPGDSSFRSISYRPIALKLFEDDGEEMSPKTMQSHGDEAFQPITSPLIQSPAEDEDMLYEYFPLGKDDWMPPIEATYIPHAAHNNPLSAVFRKEEIRSIAARYFAAD